ncbi:hypothetical protein [Photobacterium indicum]|uniref:hypothetical protein n=1 Tax=Photobacterium indicum TaxID=81447 RepID=UPI003D13870F
MAAHKGGFFNFIGNTNLNKLRSEMMLGQAKQTHPHAIKEIDELKYGLKISYTNEGFFMAESERVSFTSNQANVYLSEVIDIETRAKAFAIKDTNGRISFDITRGDFGTIRNTLNLRVVSLELS